MKNIRLVGVPEHFNLPWQMCIANNDFTNAGIQLNWKDIPEGTGKMCQMLRNNETDLAVILTEGIVKDILNGNPSKLVQVYVESPLIWGIHVAAHSKYTSISDLEGKKAAISRYGSGSELMTYVHANEHGWAKESIPFEVVHTIDGAVKALTNETADYFMWEHFMTKPLVDSGIFRRLGDCLTPWPSFVIAATKDFCENNPDAIATILTIINAKTRSFKSIPTIDTILASKFNLKKEDAQNWLSLTSWSQKTISEIEINNIQNKLVEYQIITKKGTYSELVAAL